MAAVVPGFLSKRQSGMRIERSAAPKPSYSTNSQLQVDIPIRVNRAWHRDS
jgi:hypothetical protein